MLVCQGISQVPTHRLQNHLAWVLASFEWIRRGDRHGLYPINSMLQLRNETLVDEGKISVIDPVGKYLPEYKGSKVRGCAGNAGYACEGATPSRPINIEDLMMHTSGLEGNSRVREGAEPTTLAELAALGAKTQLLFEPGTSWNYSNVGHNVLGRLIEVVSKQGYDAFLKEKIFEPLEMRDTYFFVPEEKMERLATLTLIRFSTNKIAIATRCAAWSQDSYAGGWNREYGRGHLPLQYDDAEQRNSRRSPRSLERSGYSHDHFTHRQPQSRWVLGVGHGYGYEVVRDAEGMFRYNSIGSYVKGVLPTYEVGGPRKRFGRSVHDATHEWWLNQRTRSFSMSAGGGHTSR